VEGKNSYSIPIALPRQIEPKPAKEAIKSTKTPQMMIPEKYLRRKR